jgi:hypothetical protein
MRTFMRLEQSSQPPKITILPVFFSQAPQRQIQVEFW